MLLSGCTSVLQSKKVPWIIPHTCCSNYVHSKKKITYTEQINNVTDILFNNIFPTIPGVNNIYLLPD